MVNTGRGGGHSRTHKKGTLSKLQLTLPKEEKKKKCVTPRSSLFLTLTALHIVIVYTELSSEAKIKTNDLLHSDDVAVT